MNQNNNFKQLNPEFTPHGGRGAHLLAIVDG
jgi:hypothetical protein